MYCVEVPGNTEIDGCSTWEKNDFLVFFCDKWERVPFLTMMRQRFVAHAKMQNCNDSDLQIIDDPTHARLGKFDSLVIQEYWEYYQAGFHVFLGD